MAAKPINKAARTIIRITKGVAELSGVLLVVPPFDVVVVAGLLADDGLLIGDGLLVGLVAVVGVCFLCALFDGALLVVAPGVEGGATKRTKITKPRTMSKRTTTMTTAMTSRVLDGPTRP